MHVRKIIHAIGMFEVIIKFIGSAEFIGSVGIFLVKQLKVFMEPLGSVTAMMSDLTI